jgi:outer membrane receptor protein involved in Fe transport
MQPRWRHLFRGSWQRNLMTVSAGWRFIGPVTDERLSNQEALQDLTMRQQLVANFADKYASWNYLDLAVSYRVAKGINWTLGVNNVFDKNPPLGSGSNANDYGDGFYGSYDPYGRFVHFSVQFNF